MNCRSDCGACCIVPSISSPLPGMPNGKPAGQRCLHLLSDYRCALFNDPRRPTVCGQFRAEDTVCGANAEQAFEILTLLEISTQG
ncbi:YkgJ family cysteine cluster protein [Zooshikella sp. RANM57]|uniref:YkgJ family cysteine cluster protein n=1 Tax=Zooshikella sp. RANM57 TaxID=3425863 RepID=UPI003D6F51BA